MDRLGEADADAYYTDDLLNVRYLTGFNGTSAGLLLHAQEDRSGAELLVDGRYRNYSQDLAGSNLSVELVESTRLELLNERLGEREVPAVHFERSNLSYDQFLALKKRVTSPARREYGEDWILEQRTEKSTVEVDAQREAIDRTLEVFELIESWVEPGLSEVALSRAIRRELESRSEGLAFDPLVLTGPNTANPHCPASDRELREDDVLLVDQGLKIDGYCSDLTRMFFPGDPDGELIELYDLSKRAAARAFREIEDGVEVSEVVGAAHDLIRDAGYGENLRHGLGHGVGLNVHEPPSLSSKREGTLSAGMVVTLEPGIYIDGLGGGRIEHMVRVEDDGVELLDTPDEHLEEAL